MRVRSPAFLCLILSAVASLAIADDGAREPVPEAWLAAWRQPPAACRPLQIVHGIRPDRATPEGMRYYADLGLGGIVTNVAFQQYMRSEEHWKTLVAGVDACQKLGLVVWLYDEDGYPSGSAGGLVLAENPAFEATALCFDVARADPLVLRPAYEHTHASNNYACARRYINLLDDRAVASFIRHTHEAYWQRLEKYFGHTIQAVFTDEPSLIALNLGQLPEAVRDKVRVVDPPDPNVAALPSVPWGYDLAEQYRRRYHKDLNAQRGSLFAGDTAEDRRVRHQFWSLVADLVAERYYGQIQAWCARHDIASSGHTLCEEQLMRHVPLDGNKLKVLGRMDIPGLDELSSDPEQVRRSGWTTAAIPVSAAVLGGRRRVMTEVSDFSQKMGKQGPASLDAMQATAAWQAAWGVTEFHLYYRPGDRSADDYRAYCRFVGRLNAVLKPAQPDPQVLLYYPVQDLWSEYHPVAERFQVSSQSPRAQTIVSSFMTLGTTLQRSQIPFLLIDHEMLAAAKADTEPKLTIAGHDFTALVLPDGVELPQSTVDVVDRFRRAGGTVLADSPQSRLTAAALADATRPRYRLAPASDKISLGRFTRDGRPIVVLVDLVAEPYTGQLSAGRKGATWTRMDPATDALDPLVADAQGRLPLALAGRQTVLLVGRP